MRIRTANKHRRNREERAAWREAARLVRMRIDMWIDEAASIPAHALDLAFHAATTGGAVLWTYRPDGTFGATLVEAKDLYEQENGQ